MTWLRRCSARAFEHGVADRERPIFWLPEGWTQEDFIASLTRLQSAGLIERVTHDMASGDGEIQFTEAALAFFKAGRSPFLEPAFVTRWVADDARGARAWLEAEAKAIKDRGG